MTSLTANQACKKLANDLIVYPPSASDGDLRGAYEDLLSKIEAAGRSPNNPSGGITAATRALANYFARVVHRESSHGSKLCTLLANTTRDVPFWRQLFGLNIRSNVEQNRSQMAGDASPRLDSDGPDCVLEVARRVLTRPWKEPSSQLFRSALRLIANCCADNNLNRSVIVRRGGIELMMHLARWRRECDLLLPTLFNVCIDFDEPAVGIEGEPWKPLDQMQTDPGHESEPIVNAGEQRLGMFWEPSDGASSVEILLDTYDYAEGCSSTLADLVEMASRVSLYGIHNLVRQLDGTELEEIVEASTIGLVDALLTQGSNLTRKDPECCVSICQAAMNIFSQKPTRKGLISVEGALWQLINLPYLVPPQTDEEISESLRPYRKVILKLVYEVSSLETYGNKFNPDTRLIQSCYAVLSRGFRNIGRNPSQSTLQSNLQETIEAYPFPAVLVLLSNSVVSTDRAMHLLLGHPDIASHLTSLIEHVSDHEMLHPAIDLATRLALCGEGQRQLYKAGILGAVEKLLKPTSEVNGAGIEIQREAISLIRLVIKGHAGFLSGLTAVTTESHHKSYIEPDADSEESEGNPRHKTEQSPITRIFHLFHHTTDAATKMAIGRLIIEILRTAAAPTAPSSSSIPGEGGSMQQSSSGMNSEDTKTQILSALESRLKSIFDPSSFKTITPTKSTTSRSSSPDSNLSNPALAISYIITQLQPQPAAQEAEAWFGLGLLSSFPPFHTSILHALAANNYQLLTRLKDIVAENGSNATNIISSPSNTTSSAASSTSPFPTSLTSGLDSLALTEPEPAKSSVPAQQQQDARYANVKVLVVRMIQSQGPASQMAREHSSDKDVKVVRDALEAVAADLGVDWVLV